MKATLARRGEGILRRLRSLPPRLPLVAILLLAFALRLRRLAGGSIWWDEGWTAWLARQSPAQIAAVTAADVHPPLHYWLLSGWRWFAGNGEFGLRLFSVFVGWLTVAAAYLLARAVGGRRAGLLGALLLALSLFNISWSQEIRMYALAALWGALVLWVTLRLWRRPGRRWWLLYILLMAAGLYTLYLFALVLLVVNVAALFWLARRPRPWRAAGEWALAQLAVLALYAPWFAYAATRIRRASTAEPLAPADFLKIYWTVLTVGSPVDIGHYRPYTGAMLLLFGGLLFLLWRRTRGRPWRRSALILLVLGVGLPAGIIYLVSMPGNPFFYAPRFAPRYLILFVAAYAALLGWGVVALARAGRWPLALLALLVMGASALVGMDDYYDGRVRRDDYQSLANTLAAYERPGDAVVLLTDKDWPIFAYYYPGGGWHGVSTLKTTSPERVDDFLAPIWETHQGVWLVTVPDGPRIDPDQLYAGWLAERAAGRVGYDFGDKTLAFYARERGRAALMQQPAQVVGQPLAIAGPEQVELYAYTLPVPVYRGGDVLRPALYWRGSGTARATVQILDEEGQLWQEQPVEVALDGSGPLRQLLRLWLPPEAPSGAYRLALQFEGAAPESVADFRVQAQGRARLLPEDVQVERPTNYNFANGARLLGFDLPQTAVPAGGTLPLSLYWQGTEPLEEGYKVFAHLVGPDGARWGQQDNEPVQGTLPMPLWQPGEIVVDEYAIPVNADTPPGDYWIHVGLYHPLSGERVTVAEGELVIGAHVELAPVEVRDR